MTEYPALSEWGGRTRQIGRHAKVGDARWSLFNPCIAWSPVDGYRVSFRSSNYYLYTDGRAGITWGLKVFNFAYIADLDDSLSSDIVIYSLNIGRPSTDYYRLSDGSAHQFVRGVEDLRLFWTADGWKAIGTILERPVPLARLGVVTLEEGADVAVMDGVEGLDPTRPEKNWQPVSYGSDGAFDFIYGPNLVVAQGAIKQVGPRWAGEPLHGGTPLIPLGDGTLLSVAHEIEKWEQTFWSPTERRYIEGKPRKYRHRFVRYDGDGQIIEMTEPFVFDTYGIEFAAGLVEHGYDFVVSYGRNDVAACLAHVEQRQVLKRLKKVQ